jgi:hypothetical protein
MLRTSPLTDGNALTWIDTDIRDPALAGSGSEQFLTPLREAVAHVGNHFWVGVVFSERGVGDLGKCPESVSKQQPVETVVSVGGKIEQLFAGIPAAGESGIHVEEVTGQGAAKEGAYLVGDGVVCMEDGSEVQLNRVVRTPVDGQLDLLFSSVGQVGHG